MGAGLLLFDLDGTLMKSGGAGMRAIARAVQERFGLTDSFGDIVPDGKTDPLILREIIRTRGLGRDDEQLLLDDLAARYRRLLTEEMPRAAKARVLPGVRALVEVLARQALVPFGLLTGNYEVTARIKLEHVGLNRFFPFGAFSSDDEDRERLVPVAVSRAEQHTGRAIGVGRHVHVIGDTPLDVRCALANGVTAVGVASGRYSAEELSRARAHVVLDDLADTNAVLEALGVCRRD